MIPLRDRGIGRRLIDRIDRRRRRWRGGRGRVKSVARWNRKIDSKRMGAVRGLFVDRNWNRKFSNTRCDFDLYGGLRIAHRAPNTAYRMRATGYLCGRNIPSLVHTPNTSFRVYPCIICYWWIISPSVFRECLSNETRHVCFLRVLRFAKYFPPTIFPRVSRVKLLRFEIVPRSY